VNILINSPYSLDSLKGNAVSAIRIASLLCDAGHEATAISTTQPPAADVLIALHLFKSNDCVQSFRETSPTSPVVVYLTGTDIYQGLEEDPERAKLLLEQADALVLSQQASKRVLPAELHSKCSIIYSSIELPTYLPNIPNLQNDHTHIVIASHIREVKNPLIIPQALSLIPDAKVKVHLLGDALDIELGEQVKLATTSDSRFVWHGPLDRETTLAWMKAADYTLNTSFQEGGANSIAESICVGTPVLASKIDGNVGFLGDNYPGYFDPYEPESLASLTKQVLGDTQLSEQLQRTCSNRSHLFTRTQEQQGWDNLVTKVCASKPHS